MGPGLRIGLLGALWGSVLLTGCNEEATLGRAPPFLTASAVEIDFGEREIGKTEERTIFILNKGQAPLQIEAPMGDPLSGVFAVLVDDDIVPAEEDSVVRVRFSPFDPQSYETTFQIPNNSTNEDLLTITLRGVGVEPDPCDGVDCAAPPAPICITQNSSRRYEPLGQCVEGRCEHTFVDEECSRGCDDATGVCRGDPCAGVACNTPPSGCFFAAGMCDEGACEYMVNNAGICDDNKPCTTGDRCEEGVCVGDQTVCDAPPEALCLDEDTRRFYNPMGVCNQATGACDYMQQDQECPFGCDNGACLGDPCAGIVCDSPPSTQCYEQAGTCANGVCQYNTTPGACDDGDPCTNVDTCNNGICGGISTVCNSPPAPVCNGADTLEVYAMNGTCSGGNCEYTPSTITCDDNDACTVGDFCNNGACRSGAMNTCDDGNPCTADSCDPVGGCVHTPISGNACTTNSSECPTGTCSAGTCLPTPGVACVATYSICLGLADQDVAGICSASGDCTVTQAPPQLICPGCNGLCFVCPIVGTICLPFN